jgi:RNA polymerase sigma factor (sigma-70 family)
VIIFNGILNECGKQMNKEEFKKEVIPFGEKMYRLAFRLLEDSELAKDCVQECFVKLWENKKKLLNVENLQSYVLITVRNISFDKLRRKKLENESVNLRTIPTLESNYDFVESRVLIRQLIQKLPHQQRLIIELRDIEEFSYEEIADALNLSINNIRANLSIARKKVKEEMEKIYNYGLKRD